MSSMLSDHKIHQATCNASETTRQADVAAGIALGGAAAIHLRRGGIGRQRERILARIPWLLPGRDALFEQFTRTRAIRKGIVEIGQDSPAPDFGRPHPDLKPEPLPKPYAAED